MNGRQFLVHRDLRPAPAQPFGREYGTVVGYGSADAVTPLAAPAAPVCVAGLLP